MCFSSLVLSRRPKIFKKRPKTFKKTLTPIGSCQELHMLPYATFSMNGCPSCTNPHFFKKCVPLLHETTLFGEMCAPLARNHTFLQKHRNPHAWIREQLSKSAHLPDPTHAGTKYPVRGTPHSDIGHVLQFYDV